MNAVIHAIATTEHVPLVDFAQALEKHGGATTEWSTDGVHMTAKGYALLANTVFEQLRQISGNVQTVLCLGDSLTFGIGVREPNAPDQKDTYPGTLRSYFP